ncbi:hypothetical protein V6N11_054477 [Hibiscus sabdariffa]|uniref:Uncharacterized protein n=1 Tax=Hibiscus sabdariffa TaxID=183260 RepID=A0ABR2S407_9ROSI
MVSSGLHYWLHMTRSTCIIGWCHCPNIAHCEVPKERNSTLQLCLLPTKYIPATIHCRMDHGCSDIKTGRIIEFGNPGSFEDLNGLALNQQMQQHIEPCRMKDEMKLSIADILHKLFKASDGEDQKQICCAVSQVRLKKYQFALVES